MGQPHQMHISNFSPFSRAYIQGVREYPVGRATFAIREIGILFCKKGGTTKPLLIQFLGLSYCPWKVSWVIYKTPLSVSYKQEQRGKLP